MRSQKQFSTLECYTGLKTADIPEDSVVLLECMSNLVANEMFQGDKIREGIVMDVVNGIRDLKDQVRHLVIVTNEIFSEPACYEGDTVRYQEYLGKVNQLLALLADEVVEVVYGIPVWHKGGNSK